MKIEYKIQKYLINIIFLKKKINQHKKIMNFSCIDLYCLHFCSDWHSLFCAWVCGHFNCFEPAVFLIAMLLFKLVAVIISQE